ncbi:MAG: hypothetical protein SFV54_27140 [Bryobacteraceae bacterium]|nr:hypothetical protein [Bryobacteraceae bacterium]
MIEPTVVSLGPNESVAFSTDAPNWTALPNVGSFDPKTRVYSAPRLLFRSRSVYITASSTVNPAEGGTAEIRLNAAPSWIPLLSVYWAVLFVLLAIAAWNTWPSVPEEPVLTVHPPSVTLAPNQIQQFTATLGDRPHPDITWTATSGAITPSGLYVAPADIPKPAAVTITATRNSDKTKAASSVVFLSLAKSLFLFPALSHLRPGETLQLQAQPPSATWPDDFPKGKFTAPAVIAQRRVLDVSITDSNGSVAGARVVLLPAASGADTANLTALALAAIAGAFGAWLASVNSFVAFIGSRSFVPSWSLFYLFRPAFGAGLAVVVYLALRLGRVPSDSPIGSPESIALYSLLVGLFAKESLEKLHQIFCAAFGIQDKSPDKRGQASDATAAPSIDKVTAAAGNKDVVIEGKGFAADSTVLIDDTARPHTFDGANRLTVTLDPPPQAGAELTVKVRSAAGQESAPVKVKIA